MNDLKWDAKLYQESSLFQYSLGLKAIERLNLTSVNKILDIGSGNAKVTIELAKKFPNSSIIAGQHIQRRFSVSVQCNLLATTKAAPGNCHNGIVVLYTAISSHQHPFTGKGRVSLRGSGPRRF